MKEGIYKEYISDLLKCVAEACGAKVNFEYRELIDVPNSKDQESGDEVALRVIERLGLKGQNNGFNGIESDTVA